MRFSFFSSHSKNDKTLLVSRQFLTNDEKTANNISKMWNIMNLFFGGPPEESLKRQVGKKASCPDVSEKLEASITGSTNRILQHLGRSSETLL